MLRGTLDPDDRGCRPRPAGLLGLAGGDREHDGEGLQQHADQSGLRDRLEPKGVEEDQADKADHQVGMLA